MRIDPISKILLQLSSIFKGKEIHVGPKITIGFLTVCEKYLEIMRNFQEVTLCDRKGLLCANYAISLEKILHRTHTVIRFTTTLKISEALHDVLNAK